MSELSAFLMSNADTVENVRFAASERFSDDDGPISWEIRCVSSAEDEGLRKACVKRVASPRGKGMYTNETDINLYLGKLAALCTVHPDLTDSSLCRIAIR